MRVDWCVSSWFRIKNTHSLTLTHSRTEGVEASALGRETRNTQDNNYYHLRTTQRAFMQRVQRCTQCSGFEQVQASGGTPGRGQGGTRVVE